MQLFILNSQLNDDFVILFEDQLHYVTRVCRVKPGEVLDFVVEHTCRLHVKITEISGLKMTFDVLEKEEILVGSELRVTLVQACPKQDKMSEVIDACVQAGVSEIRPVLTSRCIVDYHGSKRDQKVQRWNIVAKEASRQSRRLHCVPVAPIREFGEFLTETNSEHWVLKLVFWEEENRSLKSVLANIDCDYVAKDFSVCIVVGPEGGFSVTEVEQLRERGFVSVSLGKTILRTEQAGLFALAQLFYHFS